MNKTKCKWSEINMIITCEFAFNFLAIFLALYPFSPSAHNNRMEEKNIANIVATYS